MNPVNARAQGGAALAVSMLILIVLTLLGIAAMRTSRIELKLSQNAESRVTALQTAQALADSITQDDGKLPINGGAGFVGCYVSSGPGKSPPDSLPNVTLDQYRCADPAQTRVDFTLDTALPDHSYAQVLRETPEFLTTSALRGGGNSARSYDFARFTVTGGYDSSTQGFGAAEVTQGTLKLHTKSQGISYQ